MTKGSRPRSVQAGRAARPAPTRSKKTAGSSPPPRRRARPAPRTDGQDAEELRLAVEELHVVEEELREQNQELEAARAQLEADRQNYVDLFEFAPDAYLVTTPAGMIREVNRAASLLLEAAPELLVHKPLGVYVTREQMAAFRERLAKLGTVYPAEVWEMRVRTRRNSELAVEVKVAPVRDAQGKVHSLRWLLRDVTARKRAEEAAARQAELLNLTHDTIIVRGLDGRITFWNHGAQEMYGWAAVEALGQYTHALLQTRFPISKEETEETLLRQGRWEGELVHTRRDGSQVVVSSRQVLVRGEHAEPRAILEINNDVTERRRAEEKIRRFNVELEARVARRTAQLETAQRRLAFLAEASSLLAGSLDYETTLNAVARLAVPFVADGCTATIVQPDGSLRLVAVSHVDPSKVEWAKEISRRYPPDPHAAAGEAQVIRTQESLLLPEVTDERLAQSIQDPEYLEIARRMGLHSLMIVPLMARGRAHGALTFVSTESGREFGPEDLALAEDLARRAAAGIDSAQLYEAELGARQAAERAASRIARLQMITASLSEATTSYQLVTVITHEIADALGAVAAGIALITEDADEFEVLGNTRFSAGMLDPWGRLPAGAGVPLADAARTLQPLWLRSMQDVLARYPQLGGSHLPAAYEATAALPLAVGGHVLGALAFRFAEPREFGAEDRELMLAIARQCAQAFERTRLYETERQARGEAEAAEQREKFLADVSSALAGSLEYAATVQNIVQLPVPRIADWSELDLYQEDGSVARTALAVADPESLEWVQAHELGRRFAPQLGEDKGLGHVLRTGEPVLFRDVNEELLPELSLNDPHVALLKGLDTHSFMAAPVNAHGRMLGVIGLGTAGSGRRFTPADLVLVEGLARRAALALDNARLYRESQSAVRARDQFLSLTSHEVKTPLTVVQGYAQLLRRQVEQAISATGEDAAAPLALDRTRLLKSLDNIMFASGRLTRLVNDLLDVTRLGSRPLGILPERMSLSELMTTVVDNVRAQKHRVQHVHNIDFRLELPPDQVVWGYWDHGRLEQVLFNLIDNAVKYSGGNGTVSVSLAVEGQMPGKEDGSRAHVAICDTGIGIPPGERESIFEPFVRASNASDLKFPGLGVGLAISREIVERHGGRIWVESNEPEPGSTFHVTLPLS